MPSSARSSAARLCSAFDAAADASFPARTTARRIRSKSSITRLSERPPERSSAFWLSSAISPSKGRSRRFMSWNVFCFSLSALVIVDVYASIRAAAKLWACLFELVIFGLSLTSLLAL